MATFLGAGLTAACGRPVEISEPETVRTTTAGDIATELVPEPVPSSTTSTAAVSTSVAPPSNTPVGPIALPYGSDKSQFGELTVPATPASTLVVLIHGGFWYGSYDLDLGRPLAVDLADRGYPVWNLEYRRNGNGGGYPETFQDIAAGLDVLPTLSQLTFEKIVIIGHSAGGQLGVWAAGRHTLAADAPGANPQQLVSGVISQAGVLDLARAADEGVGGDAVAGLMGGAPADYPQRYAIADPIQLVPIGVPVRCVHSEADEIVPIDQSQNYVTAAVMAGDDAVLVPVPGDHFALITVGTPAWSVTIDTLAQLAG